MGLVVVSLTCIFVALDLICFWYFEKEILVVIEPVCLSGSARLGDASYDNSNFFLKFFIMDSLHRVICLRCLGYQGVAV